MAEIAKQVRSRYGDDSVLIWFCAAIGEISPINANDDALHSYGEPLNRHVVMQGLNFEHGTKRHSLKALSYLQYVSEFSDDA